MTRFRMIKISVPQFAILADSAPTENIRCEVEFGFRVAPDSHLLGVDLKIAFTHSSDKFLVLETICEFSIYPDDWNKCQSEKGIELSRDLLLQVASQTVGTARGIMFSRTEGTSFGSFILPPVNLTPLIKEGITIE